MRRPRERLARWSLAHGELYLRLAESLKNSTDFFFAVSISRTRRQFVWQIAWNELDSEPDMMLLQVHWLGCSSVAHIANDTGKLVSALINCTRSSQQDVIHNP